MLPNLEIIHRPRTPAEAVRLLKKGGKGAALLAGGTALALSGRHPLRELVDLSRCGMDEIQVKGRTLRIGAMVRMADLASSPAVRGHPVEILRTAASKVGSTLTRNLVTVGGNISQRFPWCHMPVVLLALDATIHLSGAEKRSIPAVDFFDEVPRNHLGPAGLIREVAVPLRRDTRSAFQRFARTRTDRALVTAATLFRLKKGKMAGVRAVAGALAPKPQRLPAVERLLEGEKPGRALFETVGTLDLEEIRIAEDMRASREYKAHLLRVLLFHGFLEAHENFRGGGNKG
ncbi:MAG: FAD binding domain-containing protein [Planctomycetota bacterium]|jgi:CO/xanthine dehydrogenase FAD-binding subunit